MEDLLKEILKEVKKEEKINLTVIECSKALNISKEKIRELINKPGTDFPFFKVGAKVLINKNLLDLWLKKVSEEHRTI